MNALGSIGYIQHVIMLFIGTGCLILYFDVKIYEQSKMKKERKAARFLGILNISLGILTFVTNWAVSFFQ